MSIDSAANATSSSAATSTSTLNLHGSAASTPARSVNVAERDADFVDVMDMLEDDEDDGLGGLASAPQQNMELQVLGASRIVLPENATRGIAITTLSKNVPLNEFNLPTFFYRSDMLPYDLGLMTQDDADASTLSLDYSEGYPTFLGGKIFWYQMPHEPMDAFLLFNRYIDQSEDVGLRQLQLLSIKEQVDFERITELAQEYYWSWRARAYDIFQVAAERKRREMRARKMENNQYNVSTRLLDQLLEKFADPEWINKVSETDAITAMMQLIKIQRMSVGLPANGNAGTQAVDPMAAASGQQLLQDITKGITLKTEGVGYNDALIALMQDPNFSMQAQSLILQVRHSGVSQVNQQNNDSGIREVD